jgi:N-acetylmuramoyl-L-alanine amidase
MKYLAFLKRPLHRAALVITGIIILSNSSLILVRAITCKQDDTGDPSTGFTCQDLIDITNGRPAFDPTAEDRQCKPNNTGTTGTVLPGSNSGSWTSNLQPPYILEEMMIEAIRDVAHKRGVDDTKVVTEEHVIALVAFAIGEGGDINNNDIFNPLNTGIYAPDLTSTDHNASGLQSFKSFDAGVEALARVMTGNNQSRLADALMNPTSSAQDFMHALTYFQQFPGNKLWAQASANNSSDPNDDHIDPVVQDKYYQKRLDLVNQVRSNYAANAALVIGTPAFEFKTHTTDTSKLQFHPAGSNNNVPGSTNGTTKNGAGCVCGAGNTSSPVIVIDPGHSGSDIKSTDAATGLIDFDYPNKPEITDVFDVATKVKDQLTKDGYTVKMTKQNANDNVSLRARADLANSSSAALAISIHDQGGGGADGLQFNDKNNYVYVQSVGLHRDKPDGSPVSFSNATVAQKSQQYGQIFTQTRTAAEGHAVTTAVASINRGPNFSPGNIWLVQLWASVPWIYNEAGGDSAGRVGLSDGDKDKYAKGLIDGVEKSVPISKSGSGSAQACGTGAVSGDLNKTIQRYAWSNYRGSNYITMKPEYAQAVADARARIRAGKNDYVGGNQYPGVDCGGFVTRVFRDSGLDPTYNDHASNVVAQHAYVVSHPEKYKKLDGISKASDLQKYPGAIYFQADLDHTYIYIGSGVFSGYDSASASLDDRAPMASKAYNFSSASWYYPLFLNNAANNAAGNTIKPQ